MKPTNRMDLSTMKPLALIIAEDNSYRTALAKVFEEADYTVLSARDDNEADYLFRCRSVDLVILDSHDGGRCTIHAARAAKEINQFVPVIVLGNRLQEFLADYPADAFMVKPVQIEELLRIAHQFVSESAASRLARVCGNDASCRYAAGFQAPFFRSLDERNGAIDITPSTEKR